MAGVALLAAGCVAPAPPAGAQPPPGAPAPTGQRRPPAEADVRFMQGMIPHHAQALDMVALVPDRSTSRGFRLMAERIGVSQTDEIAWMTQWLRDRGAEVPEPGAHAHHGGAHGGAGAHALMPGMLTPEEMAELAAATGPAFEQLFLQFMIRHHEGALLMVADLHATPGAAQATEVYRFASDVEADQRAEIGRMRAMLNTSPLPPPHRH
jgi:uncharacterized protein (DUF305 family)